MLNSSLLVAAMKKSALLSPSSSKRSIVPYFEFITDALPLSSSSAHSQSSKSFSTSLTSLPILRSSFEMEIASSSPPKTTHFCILDLSMVSSCEQATLISSSSPKK